jgi:D-sedoheptulose 7-phosphate isomerase
MVRSVNDGGTIFFAGNGGSASQAQHAAGELVGRFTKERKGIRAVALTADIAVLTSVANDYGYEHVFERQLDALARPGDVFVGISTSGASANVIHAMELAREIKVTNVVLTGPDGAAMSELADYLINTPEAPTWRIQEMHLAALHMLCAEVERSLSES